MSRPRVSDVLRVRRHEPTRLEGFVDASFAFAVTLVVISFGRVPHSVPEMLDALRGVPTFAVCFLLIARIWKSHRDWSRYYGLEDGATIALSLVLVFLVLVYAYPLRLLFGLALKSISHGVLADEALELHSYFELRAAFVVFGAGYAAIWGVLALLYRHALLAAAALTLTPGEVLATRFQIALNGAFAAVALVSAALAVVLPFETMPASIWLVGLTYASMGVIAGALSRHWRARIDALEPATPA
jgi:hypothetical protein